MAFCKYCQGGLDEDSTICPNCGRDNAAEPEEKEVPEAEELQQTEAAEAAAEEPAPEAGDAETADVPAEEAEDMEAAAEESAEPEEEAADIQEKAEAAEEETGEAAEETAAEDTPAKKNSAGKIVGIVIGIVAVLAILVAVILKGGANSGGSLDARASYSADASVLTPDSAKMDKVVAQIGDSKLTNGVFQIYYWMQFYNLANTYGEYLPYLGLDTTKPFDEQQSDALVDEEAAYGSDEEPATLTWEQYFIKMSIECYEEYTALADAAKAAGMELSDEYAEILESIPESLQQQAEAEGLATADEFVQASFGTGVTTEDYISYMQTYLLAATYAEDAYNVTGYTEADIEAYYDENAETYAANGVEKIDQNVIHVRHILIQPEMDLDSDEDGTPDSSSDEAWAAAEAEADELYAKWQEDPTEENFSNMAGENSDDTGSASNGGLYEDVYPGQMVPAFNDWCFDPARQAGDSGIVKTDYGYHIMYFVGPGDYTYWYQTAESDYINEIYAQRLSEVIDPVTAKVNFNNIYVNTVTDMMP